MNLPVSCSSAGLFSRILLWSELSHTLSCNKISLEKKVPVWISFYNIDIFIMLFLQILFIQTLHQIINYVKDKIGVVFLRSCVIFDTL